MGAIILPIPIVSGGKTYREAEIKPPTGGVLADTKKLLDSGNPYDAMKELISGCTESIGGVAERTARRELSGNMPYKSAEYTIINILTLDHDDDSVEGIYPCPTKGCGGKVECRYNKNPELDTSDKLSDMELDVMESDSNEFEHNLVKLLEIDMGSDGVQVVESISLLHPTLNHCSAAIRKRGRGDGIRAQMSVYSEAMTKVNGENIGRKWINRYAMMMFEKMGTADLRELGEKVDRYGIKTSVEKHCLKCGNMFHVELDTSNFFDSALRSN